MGAFPIELKSTPVTSRDPLYINGFGSPENQPGAKITIAPTATVFAEHDADRNGKLAAGGLPTKHAPTR